MENNETPEFIDEKLENQDDTLSLDDFLAGEGNYVKSPAVGEYIVLDLEAIRKMPAKKVKNPKTGKNMDITLSSVDYYYDFLLKDGREFTCTAWQIVGKTKAILKKLKTYDVSLKITHLADGQKTSKDEDAWEVEAMINGKFMKLDKESNEWKE